MIDSAVATHVNGVEEALWLSMNALDLANKVGDAAERGPLLARWLNKSNHRSTWFNQDP